MKKLHVKSRLAILGVASLMTLPIHGTAHAELAAATGTSMSRTSTAVEHSSISVALASKQTYGRNGGYKWGEEATNSQVQDSAWLASNETQSGYKWAVSRQSQADSLEKISKAPDRQNEHSTDAHHTGYRWGIRSVADQAGYRWGIRNVADQAGYRWGIRNVADQAGYRWGIRNVADQTGYRWGIRNVADQAGYRWGIRNVADQAGYRWGIRNVADQAGYRWGIRNVADQAGYRWGIR